MSISITLQSMSRQAIVAESKFRGRRRGISLKDMVTYVQPRNARPDPNDGIIAFDSIIGIGKGG